MYHCLGHMRTVPFSRPSSPPMYNCLGNVPTLLWSHKDCHAHPPTSTSVTCQWFLTQGVYHAHLLPWSHADSPIISHPRTVTPVHLSGPHVESSIIPPLCQLMTTKVPHFTLPPTNVPLRRSHIRSTSCCHQPTKAPHFTLQRPPMSRYHGHTFAVPPAAISRPKCPTSPCHAHQCPVTLVTHSQYLLLPSANQSAPPHPATPTNVPLS